MHTLTIVSAVVALVALGAAPVDAMALKAKKVGGSFVTAYEPCTAPSITTDSGLPACPAVRSDPVCGFGPDGGFGKFKLISKPKVREIKIKASLKGLDPACQGETLTFEFTGRLTGDECAGSACTLEDSTSGIVAECIVDTKNRCKAKPFSGISIPGGPLPTGEVTLIDGIQVFRGSTLTFETGILILVP